MSRDTWEAAKSAAMRAVVLSRPRLTSSPRVGAAVLGDDGRVAIGAYIAGATAYTTVHAEAAAVISLILGGSRKVALVAVFASGLDRELKSASKLVPCGTCLQFIAEHALDPTIPILRGADSTLPSWESDVLSSLLPRPWLGWSE
jgi:cytidine deaminase